MKHKKKIETIFPDNECQWFIDLPFSSTILARVLFIGNMKHGLFVWEY